MKVKIKLDPGAKVPYRSTSGAAGWDVFANISAPLVLNPGKRAVIPTGVSVQLPEGYYWDGRIRSGLSTKHGIMLLNGAGVIDEDYRGMTGVPVINMGEVPYTFQPGEKIAQMILTRYEIQEFEVVEELDDSERGDGGYGHTGRS